MLVQLHSGFNGDRYVSKYLCFVLRCSLMLTRFPRFPTRKSKFLTIENQAQPPALFKTGGSLYLTKKTGPWCYERSRPPFFFDVLSVNPWLFFLLLSLLVCSLKKNKPFFFSSFSFLFFSYWPFWLMGCTLSFIPFWKKEEKRTYVKLGANQNRLVFWTQVSFSFHFFFFSFFVCFVIAIYCRARPTK